MGQTYGNHRLLFLVVDAWRTGSISMAMSALVVIIIRIIRQVMCAAASQKVLMLDLSSVVFVCIERAPETFNAATGLEMTSVVCVMGLRDVLKLSNASSGKNITGCGAFEVRQMGNCVYVCVVMETKGAQLVRLQLCLFVYVCRCQMYGGQRHCSIRTSACGRHDVQ